MCIGARLNYTPPVGWQVVSEEGNFAALTWHETTTSEEAVEEHKKLYPKGKIKSVCRSNFDPILVYG